MKQRAGRSLLKKQACTQASSHCYIMDTSMGRVVSKPIKKSDIQSSQTGLLHTKSHQCMTVTANPLGLGGHESQEQGGENGGRASELEEEAL